MGTFGKKFWTSTIYKSRSIPAPSGITHEAGIQVLRNHALLARIFFSPPIVCNSSEQATGHAISYTVKDLTETTKVTFLFEDNNVTLTQTLGPVFTLIMSWSLQKPGSPFSDESVGAKVTPDKSGNHQLMLHEHVELKGLRLLFSLLSVRLQDAPSQKACGIAKAMELRLQDPTKSIDQLAWEVKIQAGAAGENKSVSNEKADPSQLKGSDDGAIG